MKDSKTISQGQHTVTPDITETMLSTLPRDTQVVKVQDEVIFEIPSNEEKEE